MKIHVNCCDQGMEGTFRLDDNRYFISQLEFKVTILTRWSSILTSNKNNDLLHEYLFWSIFVANVAFFCFKILLIILSRYQFLLRCFLFIISHHLTSFNIFHRSLWTVFYENIMFLINFHAKLIKLFFLSSLLVFLYYNY